MGLYEICMGFNRALCVDVGHYGALCDVCGALWGGYWVPIGLCGVLWVAIGLFGVPMELYGVLWGVLRFLWGVYGTLWCVYVAK